MTTTPETSDFSSKWRAYWPEWRIGMVFLPASQRDVAAAWFALLQECTTAAWGGDDATPGLAKLAWWSEELRGWAKGARRHPLAETLQRLPVDWTGLAGSLHGLQATRGLGLQDSALASALQPFATMVANVEERLFGGDGHDTRADGERDASSSGSSERGAGVVVDLLGERALLHRDRDAATSLLVKAQQRHRPTARSRRLQSAYLRARLQALAASGAVEAAPVWQTLGLSWRAARGR